MTQDEREQLRQHLRDGYAARRGESRMSWLKRPPRELSESQVDNFIDVWFRHVEVESRYVAAMKNAGNRVPTREESVGFLLKHRGTRPVGFDPITWFMIAKLLIDLFLLWRKFNVGAEKGSES